MPVDIVIFAAIAAFLAYKLNGLLGTRGGGERQRANPYEQAAAPKGAPVVIEGRAVRRAPAPVPAGLIDPAHDTDGAVSHGLAEIAAADGVFDPGGFIEGARHAFRLVVESYARGELEVFRVFVSPRLFADFEAGSAARAARGEVSEVTVRSITASRIVSAHLGGVMAYVTVDFDAEETAVTRDSTGSVVDGDPEKLFSADDVWTFCRDIRSDDPNWILVETRAPAEG